MKTKKFSVASFCIAIICIEFSGVCLAQGISAGSPPSEPTQVNQVNQVDDAAALSDHPSKRDVLWGFAQCIRKQVPAIQANPREPAHVCGVTLLDAGNDKRLDSVVVEDSKMSRCLANAGALETEPETFPYVHALAIPLMKFTGVEQEDGRPRGIWFQAWKVAQSYISDESQIALVANPKAQNQYRSQDQLHIHLVRLLPGAKEEMLHPTRSDRVAPTHIERLSDSPDADDPVWVAAEANAADLAARLDLPAGLKTGNFGVAVVFDESQKQYAVITVNDSPERDFTVQCPGQIWKP